MPQKKPLRIPKLRHHTPTGDARVRIKGRDIYLGRYGTEDAERAYRRAIAHLLEHGDAPPPRAGSAARRLGDLLDRYDAYARRAMSPETHAGCVVPVIDRLRRFAEDLPIESFGPAELRAFRATLEAERIPVVGTVAGGVPRLRRLSLG